ncbi:MerR family transcriptional regulator [Vibrio coralliilyticus]|uniref:MerR family transcriptional regulator n=1 Tax=Vibrio coralliilyticus TaxID=190893 RepID=A0A097B0A4_9VIBR|nr:MULTISPECIES: MerR family DNA-binding transcriptional regulator [Vibrio]AIS58101.1 MerR family transcriptional regulator [Vibrio coralliilyticus]AIW22232.1 MerR family transcriptional regulator [Vibrio coralliilyticus]ARC94815.1 MerR family transcriptional regulator [Vibrio coralliilyticus]AXN34502.1 MerR family DNA-binding transcriptional regulator [Vibrio coralliilyticus]EEX33422.1 predicted transcriptional regulator LiuR of leucine degradation pathway MerR family [Vibrio coralliilyticus 
METYKISELAKEFDITTRSIRFYEDMGLIQPERKGSMRIYQRRDRVRLKLILRGKRLGFSLAEIRDLLELYDTNQIDTQLIKMLKIIDEKEAVLKRQLEDITIVLDDLNTARQRCEEALQRSKAS